MSASLSVFLMKGRKFSNSSQSFCLVLEKSSAILLYVFFTFFSISFAVLDLMVELPSLKSENMQIHDIAIEFVKQAIENKILDHLSLQRLKNEFSTKYKISSLTSIEILKAYGELVNEDLVLPNLEFERLIRKRGVRSLSGIASITVITKDYPCPGKCIYCPKEPEMPKSYLSNEPAVMRAILNDFDPCRQVVSRLKGLKKTGHSTDKIEVIVAGGTFNFYPTKYQSDFIRGIFNGLNYDVNKSGAANGRNNNARDNGSASKDNDGRVLLEKSRSLSEAQKINEKARHRCVGLSVETRPDYVTKDALKFFRKLGVTKVEIGVQCLDDEIYRLNKRGHKVEDVRRAMMLLKDAGFKINVHFMPNMYGSTPKKDLEMFKMLFDEPSFRPDWLKIYPCVVIPGTPLAKLYQSGKYKSYSDRELIDLLIKFKEIVPYYCRITRLIRDIPAESIIGGSKVSNLRQYVQEEMRRRGKKCNCIRCREIKGDKYDSKDVKLLVRNYKSSIGEEYFLSFEDLKNDRLIAFLRLRIPSQFFLGEEHWISELSGAAIIREIHVFGEQVEVGERVKGAGQHVGYGRKLISEAIKLTESRNLSKLAVISGVGVHEYYRRIGFVDGGLYQIFNV